VVVHTVPRKKLFGDQDGIWQAEDIYLEFIACTEK
jgi:hypothetical protein